MFVVREARAADLPEMAKLLAQRDREDGVRAPATYEVAARQLANLDPSRCRAFVAVDDADGRVVAMNAALLRTLRFGEQWIPAAYWTNLYVHPEHRNAMLYPRVVTPLRQAMAAEGRLLYAAVRRENVANAHERIGFARVATLPLLIKPLRPVRLAFRRFRRAPVIPSEVEGSGRWRREARPAHPDPSTTLGMTASAVAALQTDDRITRAWTAEELQERLTPTFEGDAAGIHVEGDAVVIWQDVTRLGGIRFRIILELTHEKILKSCERDAKNAGCDAILSLDPGRGYWKTGASYILLADRKSPVDVTGKAWRFALIDHDAF